MFIILLLLWFILKFNEGESKRKLKDQNKPHNFISNFVSNLSCSFALCTFDLSSMYSTLDFTVFQYVLNLILVAIVFSIPNTISHSQQKQKFTHKIYFVSAFLCRSKRGDTNIFPLSEKIFNWSELSNGIKTNCDKGTIDTKFSKLAKL